MMNMENIPAELMLDIFSRLPVRSLCATKSVCKHWYHLTRDPQLPHMHLARNVEEALILAAWCPKMKMRKRKFLTKLYSLDKPISDLPEYCELHVSFDGLLLAYDFMSGKAFLRNPLTEERLDLPPFRQTMLWDVDESEAYFGMGFDSSIRKYKVVCAYFGEIDLVNRRCRTGARVCTINGAASSSWRDISSQPTVPIRERKRFRSVYASGARHWVADFGVVDMVTMVISFDFEKEEFKTLPRSRFFSAANPDKFNLIDLRGCLGMVDLSHNNYIGIWKLKDYKRNEWVREYNVVMDSKVEVFCVTRADEVVMMRYYYNPNVFVGHARDTTVLANDDDVFDSDYVWWNRIAQQMHSFDERGFNVGDYVWHAVLAAYNPKTATLRIIRRFYVTEFLIFLHRPSLVSLSR